MRPGRTTLSRATERKLAAALFNRTWELLLLEERSLEQTEELLHTAHASTYHWYQVGTPRNFSIAEWQLSRVYAVLGFPAPALHHAERSLHYAERAHLAPFYIAYGHEALARAHAIAGDRHSRDRHLRAARRLASRVREAESRRALEEDLSTVQEIIGARPARRRAGQ